MSCPTRLPRRLAPLPGWAAAGLVAGCAGPQSWADTAGAEAEAVIRLLWIMAVGAAIVWILVIGTMLYAARAGSSGSRHIWAERLVIWGGMVAPTLAVLGLLVAGLVLMRDLTGQTADLSVEATGEQWWWRITHDGPDGEPVPTPNELRLPVERTVEMVLRGGDVIHSFWVPSLGGKMDMIPGRVTRLRLTPTRTGRFRGACAEFCGEAHAQMALPVVVMEKAAYERWLAGQAAPAAAPGGERGHRGLELFLATGCGACHTIRGTSADGAVGPDLTHVGSRLSIGAGTLPMEREAMVRWITDSKAVKPGVRMPAFDMLPPEEIELIADYLMSLE